MQGSGPTQLFRAPQRVDASLMALALAMFDICQAVAQFI